ncbi:lipopolysaccharide assembly protein LapB [Methylosinus sp. Sm6]|uniref:tetratricopeptide repeat protein n=1 Tax=Methylosinus sp. Sm6 TaxID=2866948 RepID=UPI001C994B02|nr:tetratricopeptide repeat protein [Methylosinus sp. Sm6]MBY6241524.1 tetratricopeptide repeat protein [Methylosinus sp. Sm6]
MSFSRLFLNCKDEEWYRAGVAPFGETPEQACRAIRKFAEQRGFRRIVTTGLSKGGYAAMLYGLLLEADAILSFGPELVLQLPFGRSLSTLSGQAPTRYDNLLGRLKTADLANLFVIVGEHDISDLLHGFFYRRLGGPTYIVPCDHSTIAFVQQQELLDEIFVAAASGAGRLAPLEQHLRALPTPPDLMPYDGERPLTPAEVIEAFRAIQRSAPGNQALARTLGDALRKEGSLEEARIFFELAYEIDPHHADGAYDLARHLFRMGNLERAREIASDLVKRPEAAPREWLLFGVLQAKAGSLAAAISAFETAAALEPSAAEHHYQLARAYLEGKRFADAEASLERCMSLRTRPGDVVLMAALKYSAGQHADAKIWNDRALEAEPGNPAALKLAERLRRRAGDAQPSNAGGPGAKGAGE